MKYLGLCSSGLRIFFEKFVKPSAPPCYILNVRFLNVPKMIDCHYSIRLSEFLLQNIQISRWYPNCVLIKAFKKVLCRSRDMVLQIAVRVLKLLQAWFNIFSSKRIFLLIIIPFSSFCFLISQILIFLLFVYIVSCLHLENKKRHLSSFNFI